ncbi:RINT1-like protein MAG2 isoform X2 [Physcomitrium patens]|uniref:RINT1-like protein MAG2 isoform X2 n=1 Tax=Physcomitrium patens TaxID=3218 RepID=UPI000D177D77|nr:RINT1-like protein MAG2 isoform X2 [Physcomitrium patens]|eukprot:XP_024374300.1 RINT1-like protein MAG2 isoform X2 [Physcomitrella patens]
MANLDKGIAGRTAHLSCATIDRLASQFRTALDLDRATELLPAGRRDYDEALHKPRELRAMVVDRIGKGTMDASRIAERLRELALKVESAVDGKKTSSSGVQAARDIAAVVEDLVRMKRCRAYVERVLHVEMLVGDLEDSVASIAMGLAERRFKIGGSGTVRGSGESFVEALSRLRSVEEAVAAISQSRPESGQLVRAVELRLDRAASTIRSATVAEFGLFLESMGWPPPLTIGERDFRDNSQRANPLLEASDSSLSRFKLYFRVLSGLQALQQKRASEQLKKDCLKSGKNTCVPTGLNVDTFLSYKPLWAMEEFVKPFASQATYHFKKWTQKPELVCALAHSMCQEFVDTVDVLLQPIISDAGLTGYNAREEWIRPFLLMVQSFLTSSVFPGLVEDVEERSAISRSATSLWLHTVDEILAFDSKMKSFLVQDAGVVRFTSGVDSVIQHGIVEKTGSGLGVVHVFVEQPHWLDVWAQIECADAWEKLMTVLNTEEAWLVKESNSTIIEKRIPSGVAAVMATMWSVIDRCRSLPQVKLRLAFVQKGVIPIAEKYHEEILWRCDQIRGFAGRATDLDVRKVALCINAARYCENKLQDPWHLYGQMLDTVVKKMQWILLA